MVTAICDFIVYKFMFVMMMDSEDTDDRHP